jgi:hypothetical protein
MLSLHVYAESHTRLLTSGKEPPVFIQQKAEWAPEPLWRLKNLLPLAGIEPKIVGSPVHSTVTIPTELSRLRIKNK